MLGKVESLNVSVATGILLMRLFGKDEAKNRQVCSLPLGKRPCTHSQPPRMRVR